ncbi:MAG: hypothetical protein NTW29_22695 [Bacteroidetes bacterium]|nr:hypothetical protein [Bacteroidota bacterium]
MNTKHVVSFSFKYNYQAEIENATGGYYYRGKMYCAWGKTPADGEYNAQVVFSGLQAVNTVRDEVVNITTPAGTAAKAYIRNYALVYPVTVNIYNRKQELVKTISFFSDKTPLNFRFVKEMAEPTITSSNTPFASLEEIANYEKAGKHNKAAEKFAYFEGVRKADEMIKNYFGTYDYDVELGALVVKKKKAGAYKDLNDAADVLMDGIAAHKKNDVPLRDSLVKSALESFKRIDALTEERLNATAKEALKYNILVCHALLGDIATASEELKVYAAGSIHRLESYPGRSIANYIGIVNFRESMLKKEKIEF